MFYSNPSSKTDTSDIMSAIEVMLLQEDTAYYRDDDHSIYLDQQQGHQPSTNGPLPTSSTVNVECRTTMAQFSHQLVDFCKFNRETAAIAMNYMDRYLTTESGKRALMSRKEYQLAAMTCLYTAVKIHERESIDPKTMVSLSRGMYTETQVTDMEFSILEALKWRVNPPTTMSFIRHFLNLAPSSLMNPQEHEAVLEIARFQSEMAVYEYDFVKVKDSTIAFASVFNAMDLQNCDKIMQNHFLDSIATILSIDQNSLKLKNVQKAIYNNAAFTKCGNLSPSTHTSVKKVEGCGSVHSSPRSIAN